MFSIVQPPLDLSAPIVARQAMCIAGVNIARGDVIDWHTLDVGRDVLDNMYRCRMIENVPPLRRNEASAAGDQRTILIDGEPVVMTAGERIDVEPPSQPSNTEPRTFHKKRR